jgi:hypothetical protein
MRRRSATIDSATVGCDASAARLVRSARLDRLRAAGLPAVRPGSASRPSLDQARPLATSAWLSDAGYRWLARSGTVLDARVAITLRLVPIDSVLFWSRVLTSEQEISDKLVAAVNAEDLRRWAK